MPARETAPDRIKARIENFFIKILVSVLGVLVTMIGAFLWSFYLKVDNIQNTLNTNQIDNAVLKSEVQNLKADKEEFKKLRIEVEQLQEEVQNIKHNKQP